MMTHYDVEQRAAAIRAALMRGETDETIAVRLGTMVQAVRVVRKGLETTRVPASASRPRVFGRQVGGPHPPMRTPRSPLPTVACPWRGRFVSMDGTNVSGWSCRFGEPRLVQVLAVCRYFSLNGVRFSCWFDSSFRWCVRRWSPRDADALETVVREEPRLFKFAPAGPDSSGNRIKADPYVICDAESVQDGLILTGDLYRREAQENPCIFGWTQHHPERRITGQIAANGDILLGDGGQIRIPVIDDPVFYIR